ncbi:sigma-70 family RNA polymerase sigma factor [Sphingobium sp. H39-3-25]|uniref:RNA polymerase sigma factor n=1 Tax=Sphingobium arseniciresistens TaxID=3030834 RepID=UPI0023B98E9C|nr:sigma-70 family RNA polymerase sigma factor [Sphingobium arseniciresistens]
MSERQAGSVVDDKELHAWFCREVLPLEPSLTRFIRRFSRSTEDAIDIRQDVYERALIGASRALPLRAGPYLFTVARNVMINRARRAKVIRMELVTDIQDVAADADWLTPYRHAEARDELRRAQTGLDRLPPRCREVIRLRKVEGLTTQEVADRLRIGRDAVEQQTTLGMRALADFMLGGEGRIKRKERQAGHQSEEIIHD